MIKTVEDCVCEHLIRIDNAHKRLYYLCLNRWRQLDQVNRTWMDAQLDSIAKGLTELADRMERRIEE